MADAILVSGGVGGVTSDDVTARREHVLQGYTALTSDSNDEPVQGTIPHRSTWSTASEVVNASGENTVHVRFEEGYYSKDRQYKPTAKIPYAVLSNVGSPPPTRGTQKFHELTNSNKRITPAYAGNTFP